MNGERAYNLARTGKQMPESMEKRRVLIENIDVLDYTSPGVSHPSVPSLE